MVTCKDSGFDSECNRSKDKILSDFLTWASAGLFWVYRQVQKHMGQGRSHHNRAGEKSQL